MKLGSRMRAEWARSPVGDDVGADLAARALNGNVRLAWRHPGSLL